MKESAAKTTIAEPIFVKLQRDTFASKWSVSFHLRALLAAYRRQPFDARNLATG